MKHKINKKLRKSSTSSLPRNSSSANSSCTIVNIGLVFIFLILVGIFYSFEMNYFEQTSAITEKEHNSLTNKYEEVLQRAISLAKRYRNLTGLEPPIGLSASLSSLRGHLADVSQAGTNSAKSLDSSTKATKAVQPRTKSLEHLLYGSNADAGATIDPNKKDIVIGMAQNTDPKNLVVFCNSFRKVAPNADALLFVNGPIPERHIEIAKVADVKLVEFDPSTLHPDIRKYHPSTLRWSLAYKFFEDESIRSKYRRVLMADVRDTYFQSDPFGTLPDGESAFYAYNGVESISIGECGWNGNWVKDCFGIAVFEELSNKKIICSGVSLGTMNTVFEYLKLMDDIVMGKRKTDIGRSAKFPQCERNGVDQGAHNVLVHKNLIADLKIWSQEDGMVANLQAKRARVNGKEVFNGAGKKVAVVHQYDRFPELQTALFKEYVYWINTDDPAAEWNAEPTCSNFQYTKDVDLFKGMCDLKMQGGATGPPSCCQFCSKIPECKAFTFLSGACFLKKCTDRSKQARLVGAVSAMMTQR